MSFETEILSLAERACTASHSLGALNTKIKNDWLLRCAERLELAREAIREANEEVGLAPHQVDVLGQLPPRLTGTGFAVTPVVGWIAEGFAAVPDPAEVQSACLVPVAHLLDPGNRRQMTRERFGSRFLSYEFHFERHRIWGATAAILAEFFEVINAKTI